jgi:hypothetical protein
MGGRAVSAVARRFLTVEEHLDKIRRSLGVSGDVFANLSVREIIDANRRDLHCATHWGLRDAGCGWCKQLLRLEAGK